MCVCVARTSLSLSLSLSLSISLSHSLSPPPPPLPRQLPVLCFQCKRYIHTYLHETGSNTNQLFFFCVSKVCHGVNDLFKIEVNCRRSQTKRNRTGHGIIISTARSSCYNNTCTTTWTTRRVFSSSLRRTCKTRFRVFSRSWCCRGWRGWRVGGWGWGWKSHFRLFLLVLFT